MTEILVAVIGGEALIVAALLGLMVRNGRGGSVSFHCPNTAQIGGVERKVEAMATRLDQALTAQIVLLTEINTVLDSRLPRAGSGGGG